MNQLSPANYRDLKSASTSFQELGAFAGGTMNLVGGGEPRRLADHAGHARSHAGPGCGSDTGARVRRERRADIDAVVISYGLWQSQFAGSRGVLGQKVDADGESVHDHRRHAARHSTSPTASAALDDVDLPRSRTSSSRAN